jgi:hypothetical protein
MAERGSTTFAAAMRLILSDRGWRFGLSLEF